MSVLIKGREMPPDCPQCIAAHYNKLGEFTGCNVVPGKLYAMNDSKYAESNTRPEWCPLVPAVPLEQYQSMERTVRKLTQALAAAGTPVKEYDSDHIWYKSKQYISLKRVGEMMNEKTADAIPVDYIKEQIEICEAVPVPLCARVLRFLLTSYKKEMSKEVKP